MKDSALAVKALDELDVERLAADIRPAWEGIEPAKAASPSATTELDIEPDPMPSIPINAIDMDRAFKAASIAPPPMSFVDESEYAPQKRPLSKRGKQMILGVLSAAAIITVGGAIRYAIAPKTETVVPVITATVSVPKPETPAVPVPMNVARSSPSETTTVKATASAALVQQAPVKTEPHHAPDLAKPLPTLPRPIPPVAGAGKPTQGNTAAKDPKVPPKVVPPKATGGISRDVPF
jgi:hypothetical protein